MIEINNLTATSVNQEFLKKIAKNVLRGEKREKEGLSIALVGPNRMCSLNKTYRGKNRVTDVLAFPAARTSKEEFKDESLKEMEGLGEIIICLKEVKRNASRFSSKFENELAACLIHGILHLLGYKHKKDGREAEKMEGKQNHYFSQIKLP